MPWLRSLYSRDRRPERMDDPSLNADEHRRALVDLARINRFSGSVGVIWPAIRDLAKSLAPHPLRLLDVATGSGDVPIELSHRARKEGIALEISACDLSPVAIDTAKQIAASTQTDIHFFVQDVLEQELPGGFHIVTSSLFLHHLDDAEQCVLLRQMADAAERIVLINDLSRSRINFVLVWLASRILSRSPIVHEDGPLSVRAALTRHEALNLAHRCGRTDAVVRSRFPCRFLLEWRKVK